MEGGGTGQKQGSPGSGACRLEYRAPGLLQSTGDTSSALIQPGGYGPVQKKVSLTVWTYSFFGRNAKVHFPDQKLEHGQRIFMHLQCARDNVGKII